MRRNASYSPACIAAARRAARLVRGLARGGVTRRLPVGVVRLRAQLVDRPFKHLAYLRRDRHADLGDVDVEHGVELGVEIERGASKLGVLVNTADSVPAAPLDETVSTVYIETLLPVPVQWP
jgi:hypothetical protein